MIKPLGYPSLKSVIEYLEANRRIRLSARCPAIQKFEKTVPLHFCFLHFIDWCIRIDEVSYELKTVSNSFHREDSDGDKEMMPGDIKIENRNNLHERPEGLRRTQRNNVKIVFKDLKSREFTRGLPANLEMHVAMRKLACFLFEGRRDIRGSEMWTYFYNQKVLRLPVGFKIKTKSLDADFEHLDSILQIIDQSSFPLKELKFYVNDQNCFQHSVVRSAQLLSMISSSNQSAFWIDILKDLPNKRIQVYLVIFSLQDILTIVQHWMDNNPEIGKCFILKCDKNKFISKLLPEIEERYEGTVIKGVYGRFLPRTEVQGVTIPMNSTSNLNIHLKDTFLFGYDNEVKFEMVVTPYTSDAPIIPVMEDKPCDCIKTQWENETITLMNAFCFLFIFFLLFWSVAALFRIHSKMLC